MRWKLSLSVLILSLAAFSQQTDPWPSNALMTPVKLAAELKTSSAPHILFVGFPVLYKGAHITNAVFAGPSSKQDGLNLLRESVKALPHEAEIVIYCGCCPFVRCPNVRPAYKALTDAGFTHVKVLQLDTNLHTDWVEKGYPTDK